jgi:hypothetical protein
MAAPPNSFTLISTPPAQSTLPETAIACGAISAAACLALDFRDFEQVENINFDELLKVGGFIYGVWIAKRNTSDVFCESFDLVSDIAAIKEFMAMKKKQLIIVSGNVNGGFSPSSPSAHDLSSQDAIADASFCQAISLMKCGDNASIVYNRSTYSLLKGEGRIFYFYDSHARSKDQKGEVWKIASDVYGVSAWLSMNRLSHAFEPQREYETDWDYAARRQYSMTIFRVSPSSSSLAPSEVVPAAAAAERSSPNDVTIRNDTRGGGINSGIPSDYWTSHRRGGTHHV